MDDKELTNKLKANFGKCPNCGSQNINAGDRDGGMVVTFECDCDDCGATWDEHYKFVSASSFEEGE